MAKKKVSEREKLAWIAAQADASALEEFRDISDDVIESDFVPYAGLIDPATIVTKDGELLQTIKILGAADQQGKVSTLRHTIRDAIAELIPDDSYSIWLHTLRRAQAPAAVQNFPDDASRGIALSWQKSAPDSTHFVNELYLTLVKAGEPLALWQPQPLLASLKQRRETARRQALLDHQLAALSRVTDALLQRLDAYGASRLGLVEREGTFYSEQLEFLEKLINLEARPMPVPLQDLSQYLTSGEITFGYNAMEVRTAEGKRRFAAILTVKEYKESTLAGIDQFLEIPCELIISQCFDFLSAELAQETYAKQARYLAISGDKELAKWMEIDRLLQPPALGAAALNAPSRKEYGEQQTTLFLIAPSVRLLESNIRRVTRALGRLGIVAVREDLRFEECYWAQLPANFPFIVRKQPTDTEHIAGFANLGLAALGNPAASSFGPPVVMLSTLQQRPYHFHFERGASAHTLVLRHPAFTRFLLAQSRKLALRHWLLDSSGGSAALARAMGAQVQRPGQDLPLNPLLLADTPANHEFLVLWLASIIDPAGGDAYQAAASQLQPHVRALMAAPAGERRIGALAAKLPPGPLADGLAPFAAGGAYAALFDHAQDALRLDKLTVLDLSLWSGAEPARRALATYLLHRITLALDGSPTLLLLDDGLRLLDSPLFAPRAGLWLEYLQARRTSALIHCPDPALCARYAYAAEVTAKMASVFAAPDRAGAQAYAEPFGFSEEDVSALAFLDAQEGQLLMRRGQERQAISFSPASFSPPQQQLLGFPTMGSVRLAPEAEQRFAYAGAAG